MAEARPEAWLYAGPSAAGLDPALFDGLGCLPPARRGDLPRLLQANPAPGVLLLADGAFQSVPAVSHAELCAALDAGWQVWGVSSLGAIRAHELRAEGMRGHGWVHAQFARHADFTDDELCLLHFPEPPWFPVSEPLVNLRHTLATEGRALGIDGRQARRLVDALRALWFGDRTLERIVALAVHGGLSPAQAQALVARLQARRVKALDLASLLRTRPWRA